MVNIKVMEIKKQQATKEIQQETSDRVESKKIIEEHIDELIKMIRKKINLMKNLT